MESKTKSPNKLWRESGTSLSFADWIQREKDKGAFLLNKKFENFSNIQGQPITDESWLEKVKSESRVALGIDKVDSDKQKEDNTFVGLNKNILIFSGIIVLGAIAYKIYQKRK